MPIHYWHNRKKYNNRCCSDEPKLILRKLKKKILKKSTAFLSKMDFSHFKFIFVFLYLFLYFADYFFIRDTLIYHIITFLLLNSFASISISFYIVSYFFNLTFNQLQFQQVMDPGTSKNWKTKVMSRASFFW